MAGSREPLVVAATDGVLCGWRVRSELPLPELAPWRGDDISPDIIVRFGAVPKQLANVVNESPFLQIARDGTCLLSIDGVGSYLIRDDLVTIAPRSEATEVELRLFLLGSVLGILCHKRGLFPLHASSVKLNDAAIAFTGPSGAGKSTIAAALALRGHALLSDDVCVIDTRAPGGPVVLPAFPRLKLWRDSLEAVGLNSSNLERNRPFQEKYHYRTGQGLENTAMPLSAIYILETARHGLEPSVVPIEGPIPAMRALHAHVYRVATANALGCEKRLFSAEGAIAARVPIFRWIRRRDFGQLDDDIAFLTR